MAHTIRIGKNIPKVLVIERGNLSYIWDMLDYRYASTGVINIESEDTIRSYKIREHLGNDQFRATLISEEKKHA